MELIHKQLLYLRWMIRVLVLVLVLHLMNEQPDPAVRVGDARARHRFVALIASQTNNKSARAHTVMRVHH